MNLENLISEVSHLCDNEAATGDVDHLRNVEHVLTTLASNVARRRQAIEDRLEGHCDDALAKEDRAEAEIQQLMIDASAMVRPVQPRQQPTRRLPTIDDAPQADPAGVTYLRRLENWGRDNG